MTADRAVVRDAEIAGLLRELAPQVLGALIRRYGTFDTAEDAVQEALLAAALQWPMDGIPDNPRGWLVTVAARRLTGLAAELDFNSAHQDNSIYLLDQTG